MNKYRTKIVKCVPQTFKSGERVFENAGVHSNAQNVEDQNKIFWAQWYYDANGVCQTEATLDLPKSLTRAQIVAAFENASEEEKPAAK